MDLSNFLFRPSPNIPPPYVRADDTSQILKAACLEHHITQPSRSLYNDQFKTSEISPSDAILATADEFSSSFTRSCDLELFHHFVQFVVESDPSRPYALALNTAHRIVVQFQCEDNIEIFKQFLQVCEQQVEKIYKTSEFLSPPQEKQLEKAGGLDGSTVLDSKQAVQNTLVSIDIALKARNRKLCDLFRTVVVGQRNVVNYQEFQRALEIIGVQIDEKNTWHVFRKFDSKGDGTVDVLEFDKAMRNTRRLQNIGGSVGVTPAIKVKPHARVPQRPLLSSATKKTAAGDGLFTPRKVVAREVNVPTDLQGLAKSVQENYNGRVISVRNHVEKLRRRHDMLCHKTMQLTKVVEAGESSLEKLKEDVRHHEMKSQAVVRKRTERSDQLKQQVQDIQKAQKYAATLTFMQERLWEAKLADTKKQLKIAQAMEDINKKMTIARREARHHLEDSMKTQEKLWHLQGQSIAFNESQQAELNEYRDLVKELGSTREKIAKRETKRAKIEKFGLRSRKEKAKLRKRMQVLSIHNMMNTVNATSSTVACWGDHRYLLADVQKKFAEFGVGRSAQDALDNAIALLGNRAVGKVGDRQRQLEKEVEKKEDELEKLKATLKSAEKNLTKVQETILMGSFNNFQKKVDQDNWQEKVAHSERVAEKNLQKLKRLVVFLRTINVGLDHLYKCFGISVMNSLKEETTSEIEIAKGMVDLLPVYEEKVTFTAKSCEATQQCEDSYLSGNDGLGHFLPTPGEILARKFRQKTMQSKLAKSSNIRVSATEGTTAKVAASNE